MNRQTRADKITDACDERGCEGKSRKVHFDQFVKFGWDPHPPMAFMAWWNPGEKDPDSGAHVGGHLKAARIWARKDPEGWKRRVYGVSAEQAWNTLCFREEFNTWTAMGSPERPEEFISLAATTERQKEFWGGLKNVIAQIGKKVPKVDPGLVALEENTTRTMPDP